MASLKYTHAVVSRIPFSFKEKGCIDLEEARKQHETYVRLLRELGLDVIELPPDESLPESAFTDDTAVICNGSALITRMGPGDRLKETETVRSVLRKELDLPIVEIADENARLHGGDVLFTGREFFVGLSQWTNEAGAKAVAAAFPEYPCTIVKIPVEETHLKSLIAMAGIDLICVSSGKHSQDVLKHIKNEATFSYQTLTLPEDEAVNVVFVNGTLIHKPSEEIPLSAKVFAERIEYPKRSISLKALPKATLSSCCLLLRRARHIRNLFSKPMLENSLSVTEIQESFGVTLTGVKLSQRRPVIIAEASLKA